jgi:hypothetical protein
MVPVTATRDDERRRVTVTVTDPWSVEEIAVTMEQQIAERTWAYAVVYDMSRTVWIPTEPDVLWLVKRGQQQLARHGSRGPIAVITSLRPEALPLQSYAISAGEQGRMMINVFTDHAAADRWLSGQPR